MRTLARLALAAGALALAAPASAQIALDWSGFVTGAYTYNVDQPRSGTNAGRIFDTEDNTFQVPLAELAVSGEAQGGPSFNLVLNFGDVAGEIHSKGLLEEVSGFDVQQATVSYRGFTVGKFATLIGAEVIESPDDLNYSRSFLFGMAIPFTHTGILYRTEVAEGVSVGLALVNGWDNFDDNNSGKSVMGQVAVALGKASVSLQGIYGPEKDRNTDGAGSDNRGVVDLVASFTPADGTTFMLNADYGSEEHAALDGGQGVWWGAAVYADQMLTDTFGVAARAEYFNDEDGAAPGGLGVATDLWEVTLTAHQQVAKHLVGRLEARYDAASDDLFEDSDGSLKDHQFTLAGEAILRFP
ncbi:MAG: porin [Nitrospirae bacterium]|nr:MAG: porin [Nitrospirota bacterium]